MRGIFIALLLAASTASAQVTQQVDGECARGYYKSGDFCKAGSYQAKKGQDTVANTQGGRCPTGYYSTNGFCRSFKTSVPAESRVVESTTDTCPRGYYRSAGFCKRY